MHIHKEGFHLELYDYEMDSYLNPNNSTLRLQLQMCHFVWDQLYHNMKLE